MFIGVKQFVVEPPPPKHRKKENMKTHKKTTLLWNSTEKEKQEDYPNLQYKLLWI